MKPKFLMCPPNYFGVEYNINPWMSGNLGCVDTGLAKKQWQHLFETLSQYAEIEQLEPQPHLPDMVFTANAGLVKGNSYIPSHFRHPERRPEEIHFSYWFSSNGYHLVTLAHNVYFEGEGDALLQPDNNRLWMGYGFRTDPQAHDQLRTLFPQSTSLQLIDPRFYHLDTCFCLLPGGQVMYYSSAFSQDSRQIIEAHFAEKDRIAVDEEGALHFVCNAVTIDNKLMVNHASPALINRLTPLGYQTILTPVGEFLKAGGGAKCLVLCL